MAVLEYDPQIILNIVFLFWSLVISMGLYVHWDWQRTFTDRDIERLEDKVRVLEEKLSEVQKE